MHAYINDLNKVKQNGKIFIYGCGFGGITLKNYILATRPDIKIKGFIDTFKQGEADGLPIFALKTFIDVNPQYDLILISSIHFNEIVYLLTKASISKYEIFFPENEQKKITEISMMDKYKDAPKILFICIAHSSHTVSWVTLLEKAKMNVRIFGVDNTMPPENLGIQYYNFSKTFPDCAFKSKLERDWLADVIAKWEPDIIHTLGLYDASFIYLETLLKGKFEKKSKWIVTVRGGPELALNRLLKKERTKIKEVFETCDQLIADNMHNYEYAVKLGLNRKKITPMGFVPGTGGINTGKALRPKKLPSEKEKIILWPKAYECNASKAMPVIEALKLCWNDIKPCKIIMTAVMPETILWFNTLPDEIKKSSRLYERVTRNKLMTLMKSARLLLIPSLSDGIPNTLYEAMSVGAYPIVSPLDTILEFFSRRNCLFARNLYPQEIAKAIITGMTDDKLVDKGAIRNYNMVKKIANREHIRNKVISNYLDICEK
ncbi:MAG: glycosyl transferase group 1 [uncultured bacterium]|nr:MAG: glycosyl transferase group 1 [uncultured bacterium]